MIEDSQEMRVDLIPTHELISFIGYFEDRIGRLSKDDLDSEKNQWKAVTEQRFNKYLGQLEEEFYMRCQSLNIQL